MQYDQISRVVKLFAALEPQRKVYLNQDDCNHTNDKAIVPQWNGLIADGVLQALCRG